MLLISNVSGALERISSLQDLNIQVFFVYWLIKEQMLIRLRVVSRSNKALFLFFSKACKV